MVRHGGAFFRCHPCQLLKMKSPGIISQNKVTMGSQQPGNNNQNRQSITPVEDSSDSEEEPENHEIIEEDVLEENQVIEEKEEIRIRNKRQKNQWNQTIIKH